MMKKFAETCLLILSLACAGSRVEPTWASGQSSLEDARELMRLKKWGEAALVLKRIKGETPESVQVSLDLAKALVYSGRREEALGVLKGGRAELIRRARVLSRLFLTNEAFQSYQEGLTLIEAKKYRLARERFEKARELEPDNVEVLLRLGQGFLMEGDADSAVEHLKFAKKLNPYEPQISLWLGRVLHQRGELVQAVDELKVAQAVSRADIAPVWYAEALAASGQRAAAFRLLDEDVRAHPLHLESLLALAQLKLAGGGRNKSILLSVKKDLQVATARLPRYASSIGSEKIGDMGVAVRSSEKMKEEINSLLQRVEKTAP